MVSDKTISQANSLKKDTCIKFVCKWQVFGNHIIVDGNKLNKKTLMKLNFQVSFRLFIKGTG